MYRGRRARVQHYSSKTMPPKVSIFPYVIAVVNVVGTASGPSCINSVDRAPEHLGLRKIHSIASMSKFSSNSHSRVAGPDTRYDSDEICATAKRATGKRTKAMKRRRVRITNQQEDEEPLAENPNNLQLFPFSSVNKSLLRHSRDLSNGKSSRKVNEKLV